MLRKNPRVPSYRLHMPTGQAVVRLDGHDHYLGKHGTEDSQEAYRRLIAAWLSHRAPRHSNQAGVTVVGRFSLTINELILAFLTRHAERHYRHADGTATGELDNFRDSLRPLRRLYGSTPASEFGPLALRSVRQEMLDAGLARTTINQRVGRIVGLFRWATEHELVPLSLHHGLRAVAPLQKGRSAAREPQPVKPVPNEYVDAIQPYVARQVWAMVQLQRLTGMRPGEVTAMRTCDLETSGKVWIYTPSRHKTEHRDRERNIYLGPRAQEAVRPWLRDVVAAYLFQPREAMAEFRGQQRKTRKTPLYPSQRARGSKPNPKRTLGEHYSTRSYCHAIGYGCKRAGVPHWHPHQLRHNAATFLRREFGLDVARVILGHTSPAVTETYAELDCEKAMAVAERVG